MYQLFIPALSCGHCVNTITNAVRTLDSTASLKFALDERKVDIETSIGLDRLRPALEEAGYPAEAAAELSTQQGAHCCGTCH